MTDGYQFDLVVIGAGSAGTRASRFTASKYGVKVAVIELPFGFVSSDEIGGAGGTCVIRGCVPKKLLVYSSHFAEEFEDARGFGWASEKPPHDWAHLIESKGKEIQRLNTVYNNLLDKAGVERIEGRAKLADAHTVVIALPGGGERSITAKYILVATGSKAFKPDIPGKELAITSDEALALETLKKGGKIVIVGGGYIAVEFAGIFNGMGADVHLMYRRPMPLRGFDEECRQQVAENLTGRGIQVHPDCIPVSVQKNDDGTLTFTYSHKETGEGTFVADQVMFATGRKPYIKDMGFEEVGLEMKPNGAIKVDELSKTNIPSIYAIGDVTDRMNLTPVALMEGMAFAHTLFGGIDTPPDYEYVASAVFCQPPLATVGLSEEGAAEKLAGELDVYTSKFKPMKNTLSGREERALMKIIVHKETDKVVGVHMVGPDSAEIMQGIAIALKAGATKKTFDATVGIHPSSAEEFVTMRSVTRTIQGKGSTTP